MREDGRFGSPARALINQRIRERYRWNKEFAKAMGVTDDTISHWLNASGGGPPSLMQLQKMCRLLGFTPNDVLLEPEELEASRREEVWRLAQMIVDELLEGYKGRQGGGPTGGTSTPSG